MPTGQVNVPTGGEGSPVAGAVNRNPVHEYTVDVTHIYIEPTPSRTRGKPDVMRRMQLVKSHTVAGLDTMSRIDFITACLSVHELEDQFRPSPIRGPGMKMWWTGSSGGKSGARTFETDEEFDCLRKQLLAVDKSTKDITLFISFDTEDMDLFKARKRPRGDNNVPIDGLPGAKVPRGSGGSAEDVKLHAEHIMMLKRTHPCQVHRGEHGEPGYCYVYPDGEHLFLQARRFAVWAAAIAAGDATRHTPPNLPEFDGHQNSGLVAPKARGRPAARTLPSPPQPTMDPSALLVTALVPLLTSLAQQNIKAAPSASDESPSVPVAPPTPSAPSAPIDPMPGSSKEAVDVTDPMSPPSTPNSYIKDCLVAFKANSGIDIVQYRDALAHHDLEPDIIPDVPHERLAAVLHLSEGKALRYQRFCHEWFSRQKAKLALQL